MRAQRREPDPIHRVGCRVPARAAEVEGFNEWRVYLRIRCGEPEIKIAIPLAPPLVSPVQGPPTAGDGEVAGGGEERGEEGEPRGQFVGVISD